MLSTVRGLERDPDFSRLTYQEQVALRYRALQKDLKDVPDFWKLSPWEQSYLLERLLYKPPILENPDMYRNTDIMQGFSMAEKIKEGDEVSRYKLWNYLSAHRAYGVFSLNKLLTKYVYTPLEQAVRKDITPMYERMFGPDLQKTLSYLETVSNNDVKYRNTAKFAKIFGSISGYGIDLTAYYLAFGAGSASKAVEGRFTEIAASTPGKFWGTKLGRFLGIRGREALLSRGDLVFRAIGEGSKEMVRLGLLKMMEADDLGRKEIEYKLSDAAAVFGAGAARDLGAALIMSSVLPMGLSAFRVFRGWKDVFTLTAQGKFGKWEDVQKAAAAGKNVPERVLKDAPEYVQEKIRAIGNVHEVLDNPSSFRPGSVNAATINAFDDGYILAKKGKGYTLRELAHPEKVESFPNLTAVNKKLSDDFLEYLESLDEAHKSFAVTDFNKHLLNYAGGEKYLDNIYSPKGAGIEVPLKLRSHALHGEVSEAAQRLSREGGEVYWVRRGWDEDVLKKGKAPGMEAEPEFDVSYKGREPDTAIFTRKTASYQDYIAAQSRKASDPTSETRNELLKSGFDSVFVDPEHKMLRVLFPKSVKILTDRIDPNTGKWLARGLKAGVAEDATKYRFAQKLYISEKIKTKIPTSTLAADDEMMATILASGLARGTPDAGKMGAFIRVLLSKHGIKASDLDLNIKFGTSAAAVGKQHVKVLPGGIEIELPKRISTPEGESLFVRSLVDRISEYAAEKGKRIGKEAGRHFSELYSKTVVKKGIWNTLLGTEEMASRLAGKVAKQDLKLDLRKGKTGYELVNEKGEVFGRFPDLDTALDTIHKNTISLSELQYEAGKRGLKAYKSKDGMYHLYSQKMNEPGAVTASSIPELVEKSGLEIKLDKRFMPDTILVGDETTTISMAGTSASFPNLRKAYDFMDRFEGKSGKGLKRMYGGNILKAEKTSDYWINAYDINHWFHSSNVEEAKRILRKGIENDDILKQVAEEKHVLVARRGVGYDLVDPDTGQYSYLQSTDELKSALKSKPLPQEAPELIDVGDVLGIGPKPKKGQFKPVHWANASLSPNLTGFQNMRYYFSPLDEWIVPVTKSTGDTELLEKFRSVERNARLATRDSNFHQALLKKHFQNENGKLFSLERQKAIRAFLEAEDKGEAIRKFKITAHEQAKADEIRGWLGKDKYSGLFAKFTDDPNKFIFDYMPRLRNWIAANPEKAAKMNQREIAKAVFGEKLPGDVRFWAMEERLNDILTMSIDENLFRVLTKYNIQGHKKLYLGPAFRELADYMNKGSGKMYGTDHVVRNALVNYQKQMMGIKPDFSMRHMKGQVGNFLKSMGVQDGTLRRDIVSNLFGLNYMAFMGWRPWLVWRNMNQIYTTLAPRFGNGNVNAALKLVANDPGRIVHHLEELGVVSGRIPLFNEINEGMMQGLVKRGLSRYKNSDEFTRAVGYMTAKVQWDKAKARYIKGAIDDEQFMNLAGVNLVDWDIRNRVGALVRQGKWDQALDEYAVRIVEDCFFPYRSPLKPRMMNASIVGKIFGQYGTYSPYYVANVFKGFRYGTPAQKIAFGTRWIANSLALYGVHRAVGINANNFLPWIPASFTGGPLWHLSLNLLGSIGRGYQGRTSRAEVDRWLPFNVLSSIFDGKDFFPEDFTRYIPYGFTPGYYQIRSIIDAVRLMEEGSPHSAMIRLLSAPLVPE